MILMGLPQTEFNCINTMTINGLPKIFQKINTVTYKLYLPRHCRLASLFKLKKQKSGGKI